MATAKTRNFSVRMDERLSEKLRDLARQTGLSEGGVLRKLLDASSLVHGVLLVGTATMPPSRAANHAGAVPEGGHDAAV